MSNLIANPKQSFLLGASLDVLHQESTEWMDTIDFWKDEAKFFDKLLKIKNPIEDKKYNEMNLLESLEKVQGDLVDQLREDVLEHEKLLVKLEKNESGQSDWDYREKHRRLKKRMELMENEFRAFKKVLFGYFKGW